MDHRGGALRSAGKQADSAGAAQLRAMARRRVSPAEQIARGSLPGQNCVRWFSESSTARGADWVAVRVSISSRGGVCAARRLDFGRELSSFAAEHQYRQADEDDVSGRLQAGAGSRRTGLNEDADVLCETIGERGDGRLFERDSEGAVAGREGGAATDGKAQSAQG